MSPAPSSGPIGKVLRVARADGPRVAVARGLHRLADRVSPTAEPFPLFLDDVVTGEKPVPGTRWRSLRPGEPMTVNWVCTPPSPGSGGHTTMFRIVQHLESLGHTCRLYLYDRFQNDVARHRQVVRDGWPAMRAEVLDARAGLAPADAVFASSWKSAHVVARSTAPGMRFYLVQDFEPDFHPLGSEKVLAEATYRFGFHAVTAGRWLADRLSREYGMATDWFEFGCDTDVYRLRNTDPRDGVVFYSKSDVPRRAFVLGVLALQRLVEARPGTPVHLYGDPAPALPFPVVDHGRLTVTELDALYNRCAVGLSLSLTNVSLVPWEMLASGCIPVVNDAPHNRVVLDNPHVRYAALSPDALADAMTAVLADPGVAAGLPAASASVGTASWADAGQRVAEVLIRELCE